MKDVLLDSIKSALEAGKIIEDIYQTKFDVDIKSDNTPVTLADRLSNKKIIELLCHHNISIISEEEKYQLENENIDTYFVIDPLDGTREFIKKNGEFTVNIAMVENKEPIMGVVYAPILQVLYFGLKHLGAYKIEDNEIKKLMIRDEFSLEEIIELSDKLPIYNLPNVYTIVTSRSHLDDRTITYIDKKRKEHGIIEYIRIGSSIKMCMLAEGKAHEYPRFGRTMQWDTAAAHAILKECGGNILDVKHLQPLTYDKNNLENPDFIAYAVY